MQPPTIRTKLENSVAVLSLLSIAASLVVLAGWLFHVPALKSILPQFITMKANTAVGFLLLGVAVLATRHKERLTPKRLLIAYTCAATVCLIAGLTLLEYLSGLDFLIDELLFADPDGVTGHFPPGRLAPITAVSFILLAAALVLYNSPKKVFHRSPPLLALTTFLIAFQALIGYFCGLHYTFGNAYYTQMALPTAVIFLMLCVALLGSRPDHGFMKVMLANTAGGFMARRLILMAMLVPPLVNWVQNFGQECRLYDQDFGSVIKIIGNIVFFTFLVWKNAIALHDADVKRSQVEALAQQERVRLMVEQQAAVVLQHSEERLRTIFQSAFDAVVGIDEHGHITDWNNKAEAMFGWQRDEVLGKAMAPIIMPKDYHEAHSQGMQRFLATGVGQILNKSIEIVAQRRSGEIFPIQLAVTPVQLNGSWLFTAFIADITERKRNEQDLIAAREVALNAAKAKSEFLANMSHEIRTPLNGVLGMADLLIDTPLAPEQVKFAKVIQESGHHLLVIINDILDFSKIEAGMLALEQMDFSIAGLLESQTGLLQKKIKDKNLGLTVSVAPNLPDTVRGDGGRIGQVLLNLMANAIKFTHAGQIDLSAELAHTRNDTVLVRFCVKDTGIGLSEADCAKLFQPFSQADASTARKFGGTGLGLSICKRLVELMDGTIGVSSVKGQGSTFWFTLPLLTVANKAVELPKPSTTVAQPERSADQPRLRILVAEDNAVNQMLSLALLSKLGYHAQAVADGREAIQALENGKFDAVLMDCQMPNLDGYEATKLIRQHPDQHLAKIPIIALTANALKSDEEQCLAVGMDGYLSKPIKRERLEAALLRHLYPQKKAG